MSDSIVSNEKMCYICGATNNLHRHHIFYGTANRKKSEEDGCWVWLCHTHHNGSNMGVHFNKRLDEMLKQQTEKLWIENHFKDTPFYDKEEAEAAFIRRFGKNYL